MGTNGTTGEILSAQFSFFGTRSVVNGDPDGQVVNPGYIWHRVDLVRFQCADESSGLRSDFVEQFGPIT